MKKVTVLVICIRWFGWQIKVVIIIFLFAFVLVRPCQLFYM